MVPNAVLAVYDTVTQPARWKSALDLLAIEIGAVGGGLYVRRTDDRPYDFLSMSSAYDGLAMDEYMQRYAPLETPQWDFLGRQFPLTLVLDDEAGIPREVLDGRADYVVNRQWVGVRRRVAFRLNDIPAWYDAAIFGFGLEHEDIPASSLNSLRPLLPHLAKAAEIGRSFALLRERYKAALAALDKVQVGIAVALPSGEIIVHNAEADRIFASADGIGLGRDGHVLLHAAAQQSSVRAAIARAGRTILCKANHPATLLRVARSSGHHPYLVEVTPLADTGGEIEPDLVGALVIIVDPDNVPPDSVQRAATVYGLTAAEAEVCDLLVRGASGPEIAERRSTTLETAKVQVGTIMAKTEARNRGDLIRTILRVMPPVG